MQLYSDVENEPEPELGKFYETSLGVFTDPLKTDYHKQHALKKIVKCEKSLGESYGILKLEGKILSYGVTSSPFCEKIMWAEICKNIFLVHVKVNHNMIFYGHLNMDNDNKDISGVVRDYVMGGKK